mmetsp:Transcript_21843/g.67517  ORF Transcript_21843/g.67517 Transcript_21843/m.67517 type:complete len:211 (+) Transcript_21843:983-1615(+)
MSASWCSTQTCSFFGTSTTCSIPTWGTRTSRRVSMAARESRCHMNPRRSAGRSMRGSLLPSRTPRPSPSCWPRAPRFSRIARTASSSRSCSRPFSVRPCPRATRRGYLRPTTARWTSGWAAAARMASRCTCYIFRGVLSNRGSRRSRRARRMTPATRARCWASFESSTTPSQCMAFDHVSRWATRTLRPSPRRARRLRRPRRPPPRARAR